MTLAHTSSLEQTSWITMPDGPAEISFRVAGPEDEARLGTFVLQTLTAEDQVNRFNAAIKIIPRYIFSRLQTDVEGEIILAATHHSIVGFADYAPAEDQPSVAEMALAVPKPYHGRGIGTLLIWRMIDRIRNTGSYKAVMTQHSTGNARMSTHFARILNRRPTVRTADGMVTRLYTLND